MHAIYYGQPKQQQQQQQRPWLVFGGLNWQPLLRSITPAAITSCRQNDDRSPYLGGKGLDGTFSTSMLGDGGGNAKLFKMPIRTS